MTLDFLILLRFQVSTTVPYLCDAEDRAQNLVDARQLLPIDPHPQSVTYQVKLFL